MLARVLFHRRRERMFRDGTMFSIAELCATVRERYSPAAAGVVQRFLNALRTGEITEKDFR